MVVTIDLFEVAKVISYFYLTEKSEWLRGFVSKMVCYVEREPLRGFLRLCYLERTTKPSPMYRGASSCTLSPVYLGLSARTTFVFSAFTLGIGQRLVLRLRLLLILRSRLFINNLFEDMSFNIGLKGIYL